MCICVLCVDSYCIVCAIPTGSLCVLCVYVFYVLTITASFVPCLLVA